MLGRIFDPRDEDLVLCVVTSPDGSPAAMCQFVPARGIGGYSLDLMRRDKGEHPNGLIDFALVSSIEHFKDLGCTGVSLNFAAMRSVLEGDRGDGVTQRVERWAVKKLSSIFQMETLWRFNSKYVPEWLPRYMVFDTAEHLVPAVARHHASGIPGRGSGHRPDARRQQATSRYCGRNRGDRSERSVVVADRWPRHRCRRRCGDPGGARQPKNVTIRPAVLADALSIATVHVRSWQAAYPGLVPQDYLDALTPEIRLPDWQHILAGANPPTRATLVFTVEPDAHIVGFVSYAPNDDGDDDPAKVAEVQTLYVDPEVQGQGVGDQLLSAALAAAADAGFDQVTLWALHSNDTCPALLRAARLEARRHHQEPRLESLRGHRRAVSHRPAPPDRHMKPICNGATLARPPAETLWRGQSPLVAAMGQPARNRITRFAHAPSS